MKAPILGLAAAAVAFAGSSVYLWTQLKAERALAAEVTDRNRLLNEKLAALDKARGDIERRQSASAAGMTVSGPAVAISANSPLAADLDAEGIKEWQGNIQPEFEESSPERSAVYKKMMRAQYRANTRRMFAGIGEELGLSAEEEKKLVDLLSDQQMASIFSSSDIANIQDQKTYWEQKQREHQAQVAELLGAEKAEALRKYQDSLPARSEVDMIANQLEGSDVPLGDDQRRRLVEAVSEERARVPMPEIHFGADQEKYMAAANDWQTDYEQRLNAQARNILNSTQYAAYSEYQQWQKEMRDQFAVSRTATSSGDTLFVVGAPSVGVITSPAVAIRAPAPEAPKKK